MAIRAWSGTRYSPRLIRDLDDGLFLSEVVTGPTLQATLRDGTADIGALGHALASLHAVGPVDGLQPLDGTIAEGAVRGWGQLSPALVNIGERLTHQLRQHSAESRTTLHGDLSLHKHPHPGGRSPRDQPGGITRPPALDVGQLAVRIEAEAGVLSLSQLIEGYGSRLPASARPPASCPCSSSPSHAMSAMLLWREDTSDLPTTF